MADFPLFIDMNHRKVIVIGGGRVALRKVRILKEYGAQITVIAADICDELTQYVEKKIIVHMDHSMDVQHLACLEDAFFVICASNDPAINRSVADYCKNHRILVNCADPGDVSDCIFPSVVRRGNIVVGVSTSGGAPVLTRYLREKIEAMLPEWYGEMERQLRQRRLQFKLKGIQPSRQKQEMRQWILNEEKKREGGQGKC